MMICACFPMLSPLLGLTVLDSMQRVLHQAWQEPGLASTDNGEVQAGRPSSPMRQRSQPLRHLRAIIWHWTNECKPNIALPQPLLIESTCLVSFGKSLPWAFQLVPTVMCCKGLQHHRHHRHCHHHPQQPYQCQRHYHQLTIALITGP